MKTTLFFFVTTVLTFLFILPVPTIVFSQTTVAKITSAAKNDMLCHKWNINNSNNSIGIFPESSFSTIQFNSDGYVIFTSGKQVQGVWNYDETRNNLFILVNSKLLKFTVLSLNSRQLVLGNIRDKSAMKSFLWRKDLN